jgi:flavodoxin
MTKALVLYYSTYGHIETMAQAVAEGARAEGATVDVMRVPETVPEERAIWVHAWREQRPNWPREELAGQQTNRRLDQLAHSRAAGKGVIINAGMRAQGGASLFTANRKHGEGAFGWFSMTVVVL